MLSEHATDVELWQTDLGAWDALQRCCESALTEQELQRADQFRFPQGRERFILGRGMMRHVLGRLLDLSPQSVELKYSGHGKPHLAVGTADVHFNLSHSGDRLLFVAARGFDLGVDIEQLRELKRRDQIAQGILAASEWRQFQALREADRQRAFFTIWTRKEAIVKGVGDGLCFPLTELEVTHTRNAQVLRFGEATGEAVPWHLQDVPCPAGYVAALATSRPVVAPNVRTWTGAD